MPGNGKDEQQAPDDGQGQDQQQASQQLPIVGIIVINPQTGGLGLQINDKIVKDRLDFFLGVIELGLVSMRNERAKQKAGQIIVPRPQIIKPPGL